jgi:hypothetical protein
MRSRLKAEIARAAAIRPKTLSLQNNMRCGLKFATIQYPAHQNPAARSAMIVADPALCINEMPSADKSIQGRSEWAEVLHSALAA